MRAESGGGAQRSLRVSADHGARSGEKGSGSAGAGGRRRAASRRRGRVGAAPRGSRSTSPRRGRRRSRRPARSRTTPSSSTSSCPVCPATRCSGVSGPPRCGHPCSCSRRRTASTTSPTPSTSGPTTTSRSPSPSSSSSPACGPCCAPERPARMAAGDLVLDPAARRVWRGDTEIALTARVRAAGVPGRSCSPPRRRGASIVEVYVSYLRRKVDAPFGRCAIETVRGAGYRLRPSGG